MESSFYSSFTIDVLFEMGYFCLSLTLIWCFTNIVYLVYLHCANIFIYITKNQNKVSLFLTFSYLYRGKKIFLEVYMCAFDLVGLVIVCVCVVIIAQIIDMFVQFELVIKIVFVWNTSKQLDAMYLKSKAFGTFAIRHYIRNWRYHRSQHLSIHINKIAENKVVRLVITQRNIFVWIFLVECETDRKLCQLGQDVCTQKLLKMKFHPHQCMKTWTQHHLPAENIRSNASDYLTIFPMIKIKIERSQFTHKIMQSNL